jgi:hypothetical protein
MDYIGTPNVLEGEGDNVRGNNGDGKDLERG